MISETLTTACNLLGQLENLEKMHESGRKEVDVAQQRVCALEEELQQLVNQEVSEKQITRALENIWLQSQTDSDCRVEPLSDIQASLASYGDNSTADNSMFGSSVTSVYSDDRSAEYGVAHHGFNLHLLSHAQENSPDPDQTEGAITTFTEQSGTPCTQTAEPFLILRRTATYSPLRHPLSRKISRNARKKARKFSIKDVGAPLAINPAVLNVSHDGSSISSKSHGSWKKSVERSLAKARGSLRVL